MNQIANDVIKGLGGLSAETGEKLVKETGKIAEPIISARELLGHIQPMSDEELKAHKSQDEKNKEDEISKLKAEMGLARNIEQEIEQIRDEKEREEQDEERLEMEEERRQEQIEQYEAAESAEAMMESSNPAKQKKSRGSAFAKGKQGKASTSDMSATAEYFKKPD